MFSARAPFPRALPGGGAKIKMYVAKLLAATVGAYATLRLSPDAVAPAAPEDPRAPKEAGPLHQHAEVAAEPALGLGGGARRLEPRKLPRGCHSFSFFA